MSDTVVIGTRGSDLALWQANHVRDLLVQAWPDLDVQVEVVKTKGDKILDVALSKIGDKGLFTKELERTLMDGQVDICVHSMKDMPTVLPDGLKIAAMPQRADARDVLIDFKGLSFDALPVGARVATGSLRRVSQLASLRPDIELCEIRGNVGTRIGKVESGEFDALVLAASGVDRLGLTDGIQQRFSPDTMVPAVGQGAIGIEARSGDDRIARLLEPIKCDRTMRAVSAERHIMRVLEGGCQVPIGAYAREEEGRMDIIAFVGSLDGARIVRAQAQGPVEQSEELAQQAVDDLCAGGAREILEEIR